MIIFENGGWQTSTESPDTNYLAGTDETQPRWVVHDNSEVAAKIMSAARPWSPVEDENGGLVDIIEAPLSQDEINQQRAEEIKRQLAELDDRTTRPLRAILAGTATDDDRNKLREIEEQAKTLRDRLAELGSAEGE